MRKSLYEIIVDELPQYLFIFFCANVVVGVLFTFNVVSTIVFAYAVLMLLSVWVMVVINACCEYMGMAVDGMVAHLIVPLMIVATLWCAPMLAKMIDEQKTNAMVAAETQKRREEAELDAFRAVVKLQAEIAELRKHVESLSKTEVEK